MNRRILLAISGAACLLACFVPSSQTVSTAQVRSYNEIYMPDGVVNGLTLTGFFTRSQIKDPYWSTFVGTNGQVYKLLLTGRKVTALYIDGQKIDDGQIERYTAEYRSFVEKLWQSQEIDNELQEIETQMQPANRRIEALEKEMSKLDDAEEKLEKAIEKGAVGYEQQRREINAQQEKLGEMIKEREQEIEPLSKREEFLDDKRDSLGLEKETDKVLRLIAEDLKSLGVAKSLTNLSFKLSSVELIVNGKRPSADVYEKLKAKYIFDVGTESGFLQNWKWKE